MFKNYLIVAIRNLFRHKIYTAITILSLAVSMACCILVMLYVDRELGYNLNHKNGERLYRIIRETQTGGQSTFSERTSGGLKSVLQNDYPEVEQAVRMIFRNGWVQYGDNAFQHTFCLADKNILDVFDFPLVQGDPISVFQESQAVLITQELAHKLFGSEDPIGKIIKVEEGIMGYDYKVAGILKDIPEKSLLKFDILSTTVEVTWPEIWVNWMPTGYRHVQNYVLLKEESDADQFEAKLADIILHRMGKTVYANNRYHLQPLNRIYLYSNRDYGIKNSQYGDIQTLYLFGLISGFILLIGCANFINMTTARVSGRAREVGMRKVVGAHRRQLIGQFLGESILLSCLALIVALGIVQLTLAEFNTFVSRQIVFHLANIPIALSILGFTFFVAMLAGCYPAFISSAFQPVAVLRGASRSGPKSIWLRKGLVTGQFAISIFLIIATFVVYNQRMFLRDKNLGFNREEIVELPIFSMADNTSSGGWELKENYNQVKGAFLQHFNVLKATTSRYGLGRYASLMAFQTEDENEWSMHLIGVDEDFLDFYGIELVSGKNFTRLHAETTNTERRDQNLEEQFILNETAIKQLGWTDPIGKRFIWHVGGTFFPNGYRSGTVIGVAKDFHYQPLHKKIGPLVLVTELRGLQRLSLKINTSNLPETLASLETLWKQFLPNRPFTFSFLDDKLDQLYRAETKLGQLFSIFALLAVFIACLGLFGLATFLGQQRIKEIGIRKVLGASVPSIVSLFSKEFARLVILASLFAWPVSYYVMDRWLQNFAYRINIEIWIFIVVGILTLIIALATVSYQALKAAIANPVDALRNE